MGNTLFLPTAAAPRRSRRAAPPSIAGRRHLHRARRCRQALPDVFLKVGEQYSARRAAAATTGAISSSRGLPAARLRIQDGFIDLS